MSQDKNKELSSLLEAIRDEDDSGETMIWHEYGEQTDVFFELEGQRIYTHLIWTDVPALSLAVIDRTHIRINLPLNASLKEVERYFEENSGRIAYAIDIMADQFRPYDGLLSQEDDAETVAEEDQVIRIFGKDYVLQTIEGRPHAELGEFSYEVSCIDPNDFDDVLNIMTDDLMARLQEFIVGTQKKYWMDFPKHPSSSCEMIITSDLNGPAATDPENGVIYLHPSLVQMPESYVEFIALNTLCHLITQGDEALHDQYMDEIMPDWRERQSDPNFSPTPIPKV